MTVNKNKLREYCLARSGRFNASNSKPQHGGLKQAHKHTWAKTTKLNTEKKSTSDSLSLEDPKLPKLWFEHSLLVKP